MLLEVSSSFFLTVVRDVLKMKRWQLELLIFWKRYVTYANCTSHCQKASRHLVKAMWLLFWQNYQSKKTVIPFFFFFCKNARSLCDTDITNIKNQLRKPIQVYNGTVWEFWFICQICKTFVLYFCKVELLITEIQLLCVSQAHGFAIFLVDHFTLAIFAVYYFSIGTYFRYLCFSI